MSLRLVFFFAAFLCLSFSAVSQSAKNLNTIYVLNDRLSLTGNAGFWRPTVTIQAVQNINPWYGAGVAYKLFNDQLSLNASVGNIFKKERNASYIINDPAFTTTNTNAFPFCELNLNLTWNFGKLKENVSKKKGVTNDDLLSGGQ